MGLRTDAPVAIALALLTPAATWAAPLVHAESGQAIKAVYDLWGLRTGAADLGLAPNEVLRLDLSTRFDEALLQLAVQGLANRSGPMVSAVKFSSTDTTLPGPSAMMPIVRRNSSSWAW